MLARSAAFIGDRGSGTSRLDAELLLANWADIGKKERLGDELLYKCAEKGYADFAALLLGRGTDPNKGMINV